MSIGIDFGIGIDENSWYRPGHWYRIEAKKAGIAHPYQIYA